MAALILAYLAYLVFSKKGAGILWAILLAASSVILLYIINPNLRVYSMHGFLHTAITNQILNGLIPPPNPFLAGEPLLYHWGYHCLAAAIARILNISPPYAFAVINTTSLCAVLFLAYKISGLLIADKKANVFSALFVVFGAFAGNIFFPEGIGKRIACLLSNLIDFRLGTPLFEKFVKMNGVPLGLVFYLLYVYTLIRILQGKGTKLNAAILFISVLGCGFFYPIFIFVIVLGTLLVCAAYIVIKRGVDLKKPFLILCIISGALVPLLPYLFSISAGLPRINSLFALEHIHSNAIGVFFVTFPLLAIMYISEDFIKKINKMPLFTLCAFTLAASFLFIFVHLLCGNEYKFILLIKATLGITAGIALRLMLHRYNKFLVFVLLLLFISPWYSCMHWNAGLMKRHPVIYEECGRQILYRDAEERELYEWVNVNTPADSIFFDTTLKIPVFAKRQLFSPRDLRCGSSDPGYFIGIECFLEMVCGYDRELVKSRMDITRDIYSPERSFIKHDTEDFLRDPGEDVYIVARTRAQQDKFKGQGLKQVFTTSGGRFSIYRPGGLD